jgi:hypothetical protein
MEIHISDLSWNIRKSWKTGTTFLDFNRAYSPACAFSDYYNCPIPPKSNTLKVAIRAGEMNSHYHKQPGELNGAAGLLTR